MLIQPKKNAFFSPSVAARQSVVYDEDFVSETLAEIFYKQQLHDKAIKAYEKLTLMFPEKSTLFAARIKNELVIKATKISKDNETYLPTVE